MPRERANGPYEHGRKFRVTITSGDGSVRYRSFESYGEAKAYVDLFREETDTRTIGQAVNLYLEHLQRYGSKGRPLQPRSLETAKCRLIAFLQLVKGDRPLAGLTPAAARKLYGERIRQGVRADTHRGELSVAKGMGAYGVEAGWWRHNPFEGVRPEGTKSAGKPTLKVDDARQFFTVALDEYACSGGPGLPCAILLVLGLRVSELSERIVDDVNAEPCALNVPKGKTKAARRWLAIPAPLGSLVLEHIKGKARDERLFSYSRYALYHHVKRLCAMAGVPEISPHGLRGSAASNVLEVGGSLSEISRALGHESVGVTVRHYVRPGLVESAEAKRKADLLTGGRGVDANSRVAGNEMETVGEIPFPESKGGVFN
jgi:integrase